MVVRLDDGEAVYAVTLTGTGGGSITARSQGFIAAEAGATWLLRPWHPAGAEAAEGAGSLHAPMPGLVTSIAVALGDRVSKGQTLLTLEAMKMEQPIKSPLDGAVTELPVVAGQQVGADALLIRVEKDEA